MDCIKRLPRFDPFSLAFHNNPYLYYTRYHRKGSVHWGKPSNPGLVGAWYILGGLSVRRVLTEDNLFGREVHRRSNTLSGVSSQVKTLFSAINHWLMFRDPPYHTKLRAALTPAFTRTVIENSRIQRENLAQVYTAALLGRSEIDLMEGFANPFALAALCEFIGIPLMDCSKIRRWSMPLAAILDLKSERGSYENAGIALKELRAYLSDILDVDHYPPFAVLLPLLRKAIASDQLNLEEAIDSTILILATGYETTRNLIGNGILSLLRHQEALQVFANESKMSSVVVEETLRFESPVQLAGRIVRVDTEINGYFLRKGDAVVCCLASANRDPDNNRDPDKFDIKRDKIKHFSFGGGIHACMGVGLGRLHASIAFKALIPILQSVQLVDQFPSWRRSILFRSLASLHVKRKTGKQFSN